MKKKVAPCKTDHDWTCKWCGMHKPQDASQASVDRLANCNDQLNDTLKALTTRIEILMDAHQIPEKLRDVIRDDIGLLSIRTMLLERETVKLVDHFGKFTQLREVAAAAPEPEPAQDKADQIP